MKIILAVSALFSAALALPQFGGVRPNYRPQQVQQYSAQTYSAKDVVPIVAYSNDIAVDGSYQYSYQTGDGITANANSVVRNLGGARDAENSVAQTVQGSYSYTAPDGNIITVNYVADENGFRAEGAHLPTPPPIPAEIARSLELIASSQNQAGFRQQTNQYQAPRPFSG
ncbi:UNVERIFIED_CONTAM: hypothetical protein PYX00_009008 [Menopon gallinae]|uniref:Uncharacterized protein n=1 Tax=Menopon gallinae TaxID=328185 RepID=A0AAW2HAA2_9NEOP